MGSGGRDSENSVARREHETVAPNEAISGCQQRSRGMGKHRQIIDQDDLRPTDATANGIRNTTKGCMTIASTE